MPLNLPAVATPPINPQQSGGLPPQILEQLRMANIFRPQPPTPPQIPQSIPPQDMMGGYQPETAATSRFNELLGNYPERQDPGVIQRIAASMIGLNDPRLAAQMMQQPSQEQIDWEQQIGPAQAAMQQERLSNVNMRQIADMMMRGQQADVRLGQAGERIDISRAAQRLNEWKAQNPNMQLKTREDGMIVGISPLDPTSVVETGVQSGQLSDQEKEDARIEAAGVAETGRVGRAATATKERKTAAELREEQRKESAILQEKRLRGRPSKPGVLTESARATGVVNRAQKLINENPELAKWINIDGRQVTVSPVGEVKTGPFGVDVLARDIKGPTSEERQKIMDTLYPNGELAGQMRKEIPGRPGEFAVSTDGGKTWKKE